MADKNRQKYESHIFSAAFGDLYCSNKFERIKQTINKDEQMLRNSTAMASAIQNPVCGSLKSFRGTIIP